MLNKQTSYKLTGRQADLHVDLFTRRLVYF